MVEDNKDTPWGKIILGVGAVTLALVTAATFGGEALEANKDTIAAAFTDSVDNLSNFATATADQTDKAMDSMVKAAGITETFNFKVPAEAIEGWKALADKGVDGAGEIYTKLSSSTMQSYNDIQAALANDQSNISKAITSAKSMASSTASAVGGAADWAIKEPVKATAAAGTLVGGGFLARYLSEDKSSNYRNA